MGGYRNHSKPTPFVPHSPRIISGISVGFLPVHYRVDLTFDVPMDTGQLPNVAHWNGVLDGVPTAVDHFHWQDATTLRLEFVVAGAPTVSVVINLLTVDVDCKDVDGNIALAPQSQIISLP